jgi:putative lipoic acid-binding regulatory protein
VAELIGGSGLEGQEPPRIEFPCAYPVKVLGRQVEEFEVTVFEVIRRHAPEFDSATASLRESRKGRFLALTVTITATGPEQLDALHKDLLATGLVQMVI